MSDTQVAPAPKVGAYRRARRRFGRWRRRVADPNNLAPQVARQKDQLAQQAKEIAQLKAAVDAVNKRIKPIELASNHREVEHGNLTIQVGVFETRLAQLEEELQATATLEADDADRAEAHRLVDEVRREHEQVRVRMQVVSQYEERLRRVEAAVVKLYDGDVRHSF